MSDTNCHFTEVIVEDRHTTCRTEPITGTLDQFLRNSPQISSSHKLMKLRSYWKPVVTVCIFLFMSSSHTPQ